MIRWIKKYNLVNRGENVYNSREAIYNAALPKMVAFLEKEEPADVREGAVRRLKAELAKKLKTIEMSVILVAPFPDFKNHPVLCFSPISWRWD